MSRILIGLCISLILLSGCSSSYSDCVRGCKRINKLDFQYETECDTIWSLFGNVSKFPCNQTNSLDLEYYCHYECLNKKSN